MRTSSNRGTVLFVDDEPQARKYFERAFATDFDILTAAGSDEAIAILERESESDRIALLLTDQRMPAGDGVSLLQEARQRFPHIIRLLTTAYAEIDDAIAAVNRGEVRRYITKPWDIAALRTELTDALAAFADQKHQRDLLRARRESMASVAGHIAHEMRTPLATIRAGANGIERYLPRLLHSHRLATEAGLPVKPIREPHLSTLENATGDMRRVIDRANSVIDVLLANCGETSIATDGFGPCEINDCIAAALADYPFQSGERSRVHWESGPNFSFHGSQPLMVFVLHNLLRNALRALSIAGKGKVRIATGDDPAPLLYFEDTGTGIAPDVLPTIFDDFVSFSGSKGVGIGLGFCARVMKSFGGRISCDSVEGCYTRFELQFPASDTQTPVHPVKGPRP